MGSSKVRPSGIVALALRSQISCHRSGSPRCSSASRDSVSPGCTTTVSRIPVGASVGAFAGVRKIHPGWMTEVSAVKITPGATSWPMSSSRSSWCLAPSPRRAWATFHMPSLSCTTYQPGAKLSLRGVWVSMTGTVMSIPAGKTPLDHCGERFMATMSSRRVSSPRSTATDSGVLRPSATTVAVDGAAGVDSVGSADAEIAVSTRVSADSVGAVATATLDQVDTVAAVVTVPSNARRTRRCRIPDDPVRSGPVRVGRPAVGCWVPMMRKTSPAIVATIQTQIPMNSAAAIRMIVSVETCPMSIWSRSVDKSGYGRPMSAATATGGATTSTTNISAAPMRRATSLALFTSTPIGLCPRPGRRGPRNRRTS